MSARPRYSDGTRSTSSRMTLRLFDEMREELAAEVLRLHRDYGLSSSESELAQAVLYDALAESGETNAERLRRFRAEAPRGALSRRATPRTS